MFQRVIKKCRFPKGAKALDIGCGTGRWANILFQKGMQPTGIDIQKEIIFQDKKRLPWCDFLVMQVDKLEFKDNMFDLVTCVTVLTHIPYSKQKEVADEMIRVVKPGGYIIIIEGSVEDKANPSVFCDSPEQWVGLFQKECKLISSEGLLYMLPIRFVWKIVGFFQKKSNYKEKKPFSEQKRNILRNSLYSIFWPINYIIEYLSLYFLPAKFSSHAGFLFRKTKRG